VKSSHRTPAPLRTQTLPPVSRIPALDESKGRYRLRFATSDRDLGAIYRLRFQVFNVELGEGLADSYRTGMDVDPFDAQCQHLLVEDTRAAELVGTYRLQVSDAAREGIGFYSAAEFCLEDLPADVAQDSVELGRACIARAHRNRIVLFLLWRGLAAYATWNAKRFLFGCSSLTSRDPRDGLDAERQLAAGGYRHPVLRVGVREGFVCEPPATEDRTRRRAPVAIPRLFRTYLRYGAKICGPPALDRAFGTIDFLTLLDLRALDPRTLATFTD